MITLLEWNDYPNNKKSKDKNIAYKKNYIEKNIIPKLNSLGLNINPVSSGNSYSTATYSGDYKGSPIQVEFSTNNVGIDDDNDMFIQVFYNGEGEPAGAINSLGNDIDYAVSLIDQALHILGLKTDDDIARETKEKEEKEKEQREKDLKAQEERKKLYRIQQDIDKNATSKDSEDSDGSDDNSYIDIDNDADKLFDSYYDYLKQEGKINSGIAVSIYVKDSNNYKVLNIDLYYITANLCLVQTTDISPKVDKTTTWDNAKSYVFKVADKLKGLVGLVGFDENGKPIKLDAPNPNIIDTGVSL